MLINSAQSSGIYSHLWPQLMNIDLDLSGPKSHGRAATVSGAGKQNSQIINMAGWGRCCIFIGLAAACSIITGIKGKATAPGTGSEQLFWAATGTQKKWVALFCVCINSVYSLPYLANIDTNAMAIGACQCWTQACEEWYTIGITNAMSKVYHWAEGW